MLRTQPLIYVSHIPTVHCNYYECLLRSLSGNQMFLLYMKGWNVPEANCGQITTLYYKAQSRSIYLEFWNSCFSERLTTEQDILF